MKCVNIHWFFIDNNWQNQKKVSLLKKVSLFFEKKSENWQDFKEKIKEKLY